jgi:hypothetical protein
LPVLRLHEAGMVSPDEIPSTAPTGTPDRARETKRWRALRRLPV